MPMFGRTKKRQKRILAALLDGPERGMTPLELCRAIDVWSGTLHPNLARLERREWLTSYWGEPAGPIDAKFGRQIRPRYYQLTSTGRTRTLKELGRYDGAF